MSLKGLLKGLGSSGGGSPPATPSLHVADNGDGTGGVATIGNSTTGAVNGVYYATLPTLAGPLAWTLAGNHTGNGVVTLTETGNFIWTVTSTLHGQSVLGNPVYQPLTSPITGDSFEDQIADAIVLELNNSARDWAGVFAAEDTTAVNTRAPWYSKPSQVAKLACWVVATELDHYTSGNKHHRIARDARAFDYMVIIELVRFVKDPTDSGTLRGLAGAAEKIHDWFDDAHELTGLPGWICIQADRKELVNLALLRSDNVWETAIAVDVRGYRP